MARARLASCAGPGYVQPAVFTPGPMQRASLGPPCILDPVALTCILAGPGQVPYAVRALEQVPCVALALD